MPRDGPIMASLPYPIIILLPPKSTSSYTYDCHIAIQDVDTFVYVTAVSLNLFLSLSPPARPDRLTFFRLLFPNGEWHNSTSIVDIEGVVKQLSVCIRRDILANGTD